MNDQAPVSAPEKPSVVERGRRFYGMVLNRMGVSGTGAAVAAKLELSEATISRAKEDLERGCGVIAALGLKVVDDKKVCVDRAEIDSLRRLRRRVEDHCPWVMDEGDE